jgi:hypothetical protein
MCVRKQQLPLFLLFPRTTPNIEQMFLRNVGLFANCAIQNSTLFTIFNVYWEIYANITLHSSRTGGRSCRQVGVRLWNTLKIANKIQCLVLKQSGYWTVYRSTCLESRDVVTLPTVITEEASFPASRAAVASVTWLDPSMHCRILTCKTQKEDSTQFSKPSRLLRQSIGVELSQETCKQLMDSISF